MNAKIPSLVRVADFTKRTPVLKGLCFQANGFQIHGQSITPTDIGSLTTVSSFEGTPATRLFELGFDQSLWDKHFPYASTS